jgi:hypothetical protein
VTIRSQSRTPTHSPTIAFAADGLASADRDGLAGVRLDNARLDGAKLDGATVLVPPPPHPASAIASAPVAARIHELVRTP